MGKCNINNEDFGFIDLYRSSFFWLGFKFLVIFNCSVLLIFIMFYSVSDLIVIGIIFIIIYR